MHRSCWGKTLTSNCNGYSLLNPVLVKPTDIVTRHLWTCFCTVWLSVDKYRTYCTVWLPPKTNMWSIIVLSDRQKTNDTIMSCFRLLQDEYFLSEWNKQIWNIIMCFWLSQEEYLVYYWLHNSQIAYLIIACPFVKRLIINMEYLVSLVVTLIQGWNIVSVWLPHGSYETYCLFNSYKAILEQTQLVVAWDLV